ncbi:MAG: Uma2 family endonuclease [Spirulina sp. SIO3F2]|nr:Uma2 family endonuclease [Spirulina sp. SIO3F2]
MLTLTLEPVVTLTDEQFFQICQINQELQLERTAQGEIVVMPMRGGEISHINLILSTQLWLWNEQTQLGVGFSSTTGFQLPNRSVRSPDLSWITQTRWDALTVEEREKFAPLCPDFAAELRSPSDRLPPLQTKMQEYLANGCRLGWLIDRHRNQVEIYQPGQSVQTLNQPQTLSGANVLPGFTLDLSKVWPK